MKHILIVVIVLIYCLDLEANRKDWTGNINNEWNVADNWTPVGIPTSIDSVITFYGDLINIPVGYTAQATYVRFLHTVNNYGSLEIDGGKADIWASFYNHGSISITNSTYDNALDLDPIQNLDRYFYNFGEVTIDGATGDAINQELYNRLINYSSGVITIKNYSGKGFKVNLVENYGKIKMEDFGTGGFYLESATDSILNKACGRINNFNKWEVSDGLVLNEGAIRHKSIHNDIFTNDLVNNGLIEDIDGDLATYNIINGGFIVKPYLNKINEGQGTQVFTAFGNQAHTCAGLYNDKALTSFAGSYNNTSHLWTPNQNAIGDTLLYAPMIHTTTGCIDTVRFKPNIPVVSVNYWIGNSGSWTNASKWSYGTVPTINDKTGIFNSNADVWIPSNQHITVKDLYVKGNFLVRQSASLTVDNNTLGSSITCDSCEIINNGLIHFNKTSSGLYISRGKLINNNNINCDSTSTAIYLSGTASDTSHYMKNYGTVIGTHGPIITGNNMPLYNYGNIILTEIISDGLNFDDLINHGNISITGNGITQGKAIINNLTNQASGLVIIHDIEYGLYSCDFINSGQLNIDTSKTGLFITDYSENLTGGAIKIEHSETGALISDYLTNRLGGIIMIKNGEKGMKITGSFLSTDYLFNEGYVLIDSMTNDGIELLGIIENQESGELYINHCGGNGVFCNDDGNSLRNNDSALLSVKNCGANALYLQGTSVTNESLARIIIDSVSLDGVHMGSYNNIYHSYITNSGNISLGTDIGGDGLAGHAMSVFTNNPCHGTVQTEAAYSFPGIFQNYGIFKQLKPASISLTSNFTNSGIIYDPHQIINASSFTNQGLFISEKTGNFVEGETISEVLVDESSAIVYDISNNWYLDSGLSLLGGSYDQVTNTFIPLTVAIDSSMFYFQVSKSSCSFIVLDTMSINFENPITASCGNIGWLGGKGSWDNTSKWDKNRVPTLCDTVLITQVLDSIILNNPNVIEVSSIVNHGNLLISNQSELHILQSTAAAILNFNNVHNSGTIKILNSSNNGYVGMDNSTFTNIGSLQIYQSANHGLWMRNAIFDNKVGAAVLIQDSAQDDLRLIQNSIFYQRGSYMGQ